MFKPVYKRKLFVLFILITLLLTSCKEKTPELLKENQFVLGTLGQINIYSPSVKKGNEIIAKAYQRINEIENIMSTTIVDSDVYKINKNAGIQPIEVTEETLEVLKEGMKYHKLSNDTFHIGLGTLSELWGINKPSDENLSPKIPTLEEIEIAKKHIDLKNLEINNDKVFINDTNMHIDLGGIAKGYAVDEAVKLLKAEGIESGFINLGGDIYVLDAKPTDGTSWKMGIQRPEIGATDVIAMVELTNRSIVTSGNYQRYLEEYPEYHHILDPATGYPATNELTSVTIISDSSMEGDALSTAAFIMGLDEGMKFIENRPNAEGIFITKDKKVYITPGIEEKFQILDDNYKLTQ